MAGQRRGEDEDYADFLARKYGLGALGQDDESASEDGITASAQNAPYPEARRPSTGPRPPTARSLANAPSWQRLSRNRAAKRSSSLDYTQHQHLSTMYHMHRRIAEMYNKSGQQQQQQLLQQQVSPGCGGGHGGAGGMGMQQRVMTSTCRSASFGMPSSARLAGSRPTTAPCVPRACVTQEEPGVAIRVHEAVVAQQVPAMPVPPSFSKRRVQNTAAALKTAILDEVVANRIYEGQRLKALFRSYLKLNAAESFFPTLQQVIQELSAELGVA